MAYKRSRQTFEADLQKQESQYVLYGTPLPPLDERVRDDGSFVPVWKQEVTDDRGRKRLHGAFTGGYSAGYFNTVGSKEGWTPSAFVSSRQKSNSSQQPRQQRVEDFMDEEDLREAEESRALQTSDTFAGFGDAQNTHGQGALIDIFRPNGETVGTKLLKRMGWKEGQGIGPRIKRAADLGEGQFSNDQTHTFAPLDAPIIALSHKTDRRGLGFQSSDSSVTAKFDTPARSRQAENADEPEEEIQTSRNPTSLFGPRGTAKGRKGGFGVGVLNDTGSDDEDPYSMGPKISYNKTIGGHKADRKDKKKTQANPLLRNKQILLSKKAENFQHALRKCHDGKLPLDGFVLGDQLDAMSSLTITRENYRPPEVPSGWVSKLSSAQDEQGVQTYLSVSESAKASSHDAKSRASALGEKALPGKSVFDYLSAATRDRIAAVTGNPNLPAGLGEAPLASDAKTVQPDLTDSVPFLDQSAALQALNRSTDSSIGWMPYAEDLSKRERYKSFLRLKAGLDSAGRGSGLPLRAEGMSQSDWVNEMNEFARAAEVFKPISGLMASRFTSSGTTSTPSEDVDSSNLLAYKRSKPEDPAESAAKLGMFGHMTRSVSNFYPTRLLCKRFGVAMPNIDHAPPADEVPPAAPSREDLLSNTSKFQSAGYQSNEKSEPIAQSSTESAMTDNASVSSALGTEVAGLRHRVNPDQNEVLEQEKPGMALFKSIFGSDDEDEDT